MPETLELLPSPELNGFEPVLPTPAPRAYKTEWGLTASLDRKYTAVPLSGLYPRDGTASVTDIETAISHLTIPDQRLNVIVSSGMAAVNGAVDFALERRGEELGRPPKLVHSTELYSQSLKSFRGLQLKGVSKAGFQADWGVKRIMADEEPDVIFAETVANTPGMPVFDIHGLLAITRAQPEEEAPIIVVDNTLPLSTGLNFADILTPEDKVLVVESATKGPLHNSGPLGVVYSRNRELMDDFRKHKATKGMVTSTGAGGIILRAIEATTPGYHERNRALYRSTGKLAVALAEAQEERGLGSQEFTVSFPTFADHPDHAYVSEHFTEGVSPVVFIACTRLGEEGVARNLLKRLYKHPSIDEQIKEGQIFMGQSFGYKEARLLHDRDAPQVRIAGGYDIDSDALAKALKQAAVEI